MAFNETFSFTGDYREIMVSSDWVERIRAQISAFGANDFTISAIIKQNPNNVGTILAFSRGLLRYYNLFSAENTCQDILKTEGCNFIVLCTKFIFSVR